MLYYLLQPLKIIAWDVECSLKIQVTMGTKGNIFLVEHLHSSNSTFVECNIHFLRSVIACIIMFVENTDFMKISCVPVIHKGIKTCIIIHLNCMQFLWQACDGKYFL